jgi:hypothetical protein
MFYPRDTFTGCLRILYLPICFITRAQGFQDVDEGFLIFDDFADCVAGNIGVIGDGADQITRAMPCSLPTFRVKRTMPDSCESLPPRCSGARCPVTRAVSAADGRRAAQHGSCHGAVRVGNGCWRFSHLSHFGYWSDGALLLSPRASFNAAAAMSTGRGPGRPTHRRWLVHV